MWVHRISGTVILLITIAMGLVGIKQMNWELPGTGPHSLVSLITFFATLFVAVGGVFARSRIRGVQWKSKFIQRVKFIH